MKAPLRMKAPLAITLLVAAAGAQANLVINPIFGASITGSANAAQIENAIDQAIAAVDSLYVNPVTISVDFSYNAAAPGNLLSTYQFFNAVSYQTYVNALTTDSAAHPGNAVLQTALANLSKGNDANGRRQMALTDAQYQMLGFGTPGNPAPSININSTQPFGFTQPTNSSSFDLIGGLEHELNEVLGGGGAGSTLGNSNSFFSSKYGALDLYRYSAANTPGYSTSDPTAYFSVDGGATSIIGFNQSSGGDYADFSPSCGSNGSGLEYIQNAFNCTGPYEAYTGSTPEAAMLQSIGWDLSSNKVPEPASGGIVGLGLAALALSRKRQG